MNSVLVVILAKGLQFPFKVMRAPEEQIIQKLPIIRSNPPLNECMRRRLLRDALDSLNLEDSQIGLPSVIAEQGIIVVGSQVFWNSFEKVNLVKQTTLFDTINIAWMYTEANYTPRKSVHDNEHPVTPQAD